MAAHKGRVAFAGLVKTDLPEFDVPRLFQLDSLDLFQIAALGNVAERDLARVRLGVFHKAFPVMEARVILADVDLAVDDLADGEGDVVLGGVLLQDAADIVRHAIIVVLQERVAVSGRCPEIIEAERGVAAGLVDHDDRHTEIFADLLEKRAGHGVRPAAGTEGNDDRNRTPRVIFGFFGPQDHTSA